MEATDGPELGQRIAAAARARLGERFRPQGRGIRGYDCVGLIVASYGDAGVFLDVPAFAMLGHSRADAYAWLERVHMARIAVAEARPGDVLLEFPAARQAHLGIRTPRGFIEANAGIRKVIERPLGDDGRWESAWRMQFGSD